MIRTLLASNDETHGFSCLHFFVLILAGVLLLTAPFFLAEFESARERAISLMRKGLLVGTLVGVIAAARTATAHRRGVARTSRGTKYVAGLGLVGYALFAMSGPTLLGALSGLGAGVMIAFAVVFPACRAWTRASR